MFATPVAVALCITAVDLTWNVFVFLATFTLLVSSVAAVFVAWDECESEGGLPSSADEPYRHVRVIDRGDVCV